MNETQRRDKLRQVWIDRWRLETIEGEELGSEDDWGRIDGRLRYYDAIVSLTRQKPRSLFGGDRRD